MSGSTSSVALRPMASVRLRHPSIDILHFESAEVLAEQVMGESQRGGRFQGVLIATNAEKLVALYERPDLFDACRNPVFFADGSSIRVVLGDRRLPRSIPGVELWLHLIERAAYWHAKVLILGGVPDVAAESLRIIRGRHPSLDCRVLDGYRAYRDYVAALQDERPDLVVVARNSPEQEVLIGRLQEVWSEAVYIGVGGSLDVLTGRRRRAPKIWRDLNLEFAYRLLRQPWRIRRQLRLFSFMRRALLGHFGARVEYFDG